MSLAFVVAPEKLIKSFSYLVSVRMVSLDWMNQKLLGNFMKDGRYRETLQIIREENKVKASLMCSILDTLKPLGITYEPPKGGVYVWCKLPEPLDSRDVARRCRQQGLSLVSGDMFYPNRNNGTHHLRLNFSFEPEERIREGMAIFTDILQVMIKNE